MRFMYLQEIKSVSKQAGNTRGSQCVVRATEQAEWGGGAEGDGGTGRVVRAGDNELRPE